MEIVLIVALAAGGRPVDLPSRQKLGWDVSPGQRLSPRGDQAEQGRAGRTVH